MFSQSSASALASQPVISHLKTGESGFASHEFIAIFNNSDEAVDVTDWCIYYASATDATKTKLVCLTTDNSNVSLNLAPFGYARFATSDFSSTIENFIADGIFNPGISGTSGHIRLLDQNGEEVDKIGYGNASSPETTAVSAHESGYILLRKSIQDSNLLSDTNNNFEDFEQAILETIPQSGLIEVEATVDVCSNLDGLQPQIPLDYFFDQNGECSADKCQNIDGLQTLIPDGYSAAEDGNCTAILLNIESSTLLITELLPNSESIDTGNEFIEIYNPNQKQVDLGGYKLELGPSFTKNHIFENQILNPMSYISFSDILTGLTLPNGSASLRLVAPSGDIVSQTDSYQDPKNNEAWALIEGAWQYTSYLTPGAKNIADDVVTANTFSDSGALADCGPGKFRNPETNRCKSISSDDQELKPCLENQQRNPETNRCRNTASSSTLVACKSGQQRNPETNRCRAIVSTASSLKPCSPGQERNPETNRCRKAQALGASSLANVQDVPTEPKDSFNMMVLIGIALIAAGYAIFEWRVEIFNQLSKIKIARQHQ